MATLQQAGQVDNEKDKQRPAKVGETSSVTLAEAGAVWRGKSDSPSSTNESGAETWGESQPGTDERQCLITKQGQRPMTPPQPPTSQNAATSARVEAREASGAGWHIGQTVRCVRPCVCSCVVRNREYVISRVDETEFGTFLFVPGMQYGFDHRRFVPVEAPNVPTP